MPIEEKLIMIGVDIATDVLMDLYFEMKNKGQKTITAEEILEKAIKWKNVKEIEIKKVRERLTSG